MRRLLMIVAAGLAATGCTQSGDNKAEPLTPAAHTPDKESVYVLRVPTRKGPAPLARFKGEFDVK